MTWAKAMDKANTLAKLFRVRYRVSKIGGQWIALPGSERF